MIGRIKKTRIETYRPAAKTQWVIGTFLCVVFALLPIPVRAEETAHRSTVLLIEYKGSTVDNDALFKAVQAQLSGAPLTLKRLYIDPNHTSYALGEETALHNVKEHGADMAVWVEEKEDFRVYFYIPEAEGRKLVFTRTINPKSDSRTGRYDVIAIAVSAMVEGLLITHGISPEHKVEPLSQPPMPIKKETPVQRRKWLELFASYTGTHFATDMVIHGATLGLGFLPMDHAAVTASYTQNVPAHFKNNDLTLEFVSRMVSVSAAGRIRYKSLEFRIGAAWTIDLRSFSAAGILSTVEAEPSGFRGVHSLSPFISIAWIFNDRIGLFGNLGAAVMLNETTYKITNNNEDIPVVDPFYAKLVWQFGLTIRI
jgi:hypothetical protein